MAIEEPNRTFVHRILNVSYSIRNAILITADVLALVFSYLGAYLLHYPFNYNFWISRVLIDIPVVVIAGIGVFITLRMYRTLWRYASIDALFVTFYSTLVASGISAAALVLLGRTNPHWSVYVTQWMILFLLVGAGRFSIRFVRRVSMNGRDKDKIYLLNKHRERTRILIFGAGDTGESIARDIQQKAQGHNLQLVGFIDDDQLKWGKSIHNAPIFGGKEKVKDIVFDKTIDELVVAMPSLPGSKMRQILNYLQAELNGHVKLKTVPGVPELIEGKITFDQVRQFDIRDLLRRSPVVLDIGRVERLVKGKSVLISGAGGSIGSEICRQVADCKPSKIIIFDISEPNLYLIYEELLKNYPGLEIIPVVGDICHRLLVDRIFKEHSPKLVFHAAAYKHVPLMEENPWSAIMNNIVGTRVLASVSAKHNVSRFVMISTDKAVRPSSIMGASKRLCEMLVQAQPHTENAVYSVVRFGNVMGSSGSVIPKFRQQIQDGGPVTITHPEVTRFFMLTSEAVQLVLQASTLDRDDAIYILDMGESVKIDDMARDMIRLSGLQPDVDIKIKYIGLRPGEKLYEELYHAGTGLQTEIEKIWVTAAPRPEPEAFFKLLDELLEHCYTLPRSEIIEYVTKLVPDFCLPDSEHDVSVEESTVSHKQNGRNGYKSPNGSKVILDTKLLPAHSK